MRHKAKEKALKTSAPAKPKSFVDAFIDATPDLTQKATEDTRIAQLEYGLKCVVEHLDSKFSPGVFTAEEREKMGLPRAP